MGEEIKTRRKHNKILRFFVYLVIIGATAGNVVLFWDKYPVRFLFVSYTIVLGI